MNQNQSSNETYNSLQSQSSIYNLNKFNNQNQILKPMAIPQGQIQPVQIVINQMAQPNVIYIDTTNIKLKQNLLALIVLFVMLIFKLLWKRNAIGILVYYAIVQDFALG